MSDFTRHCDKDLIERLKTEAFWKSRLKEDCKDCKDGAVFLAFRKGNIAFYHKGGTLFTYDKNGFKTHKKYAAVIDAKDENKNYLSEAELKDYKLISEFSPNLAQIKENCDKFSRDEASGVSDIYHKHSYLSKNDDVVVLDIEIVFDSDEKNRIDILLFNKPQRKLRFVEAKHFSNSEIWSTGKPAVVGQIERYEKTILERKDVILNEYKQYIHDLNDLFEINLPDPSTIDEEVELIIFGFDQDQKAGRLKDLVVDNSEYKGKLIYRKGHQDDINMQTFWKGELLK